MLRLMLDSHKELAVLPETHFVPRLAELCASAEDPAAAALQGIVESDRWHSFELDAEALKRQATTAGCSSLSDVLRLFYTSYAASHGKPRWGDKTPFYVLAMARIACVLEEAHFIHIIRDGRDVALSVLPLWWGPHTVPVAAAWWADRVRRGRRAGADLPYLEVRYEQVVERPEAELRRVCAFVELDFDPQMLSFARRVREQATVVARISSISALMLRSPPSPPRARACSGSSSDRERCRRGWRPGSAAHPTAPASDGGGPR